MPSVVKVPGAGLSLGRNPLTDSSGCAELEGATLRDDGIVEPLAGFGDQASTGSASLVRQLCVHEDELYGEHLVLVQNERLLLATSAAPATLVTMETPDGDEVVVTPAVADYNQVSLAQVNEHVTLAATDRGVIAVRPAATLADSVMQEAGLPELTSCLPRLYAGVEVGFLDGGSATAYRATLERAYGDNHRLISAPSGRGVLRSTLSIPAGSLSRATVTVTVTCVQPHGMTASGAAFVLESDDGPLAQDDNFPPGAKTVASIVSEYVFTYTEAYGSVSATSTKGYHVHLNTTRSTTFVVAGASISKASSVLTITLPAAHGIPVGSHAGWSLRLYQTTGMTPDGAFAVGLYGLIDDPTTTPTAIAASFASGTATSGQPYYVVLIPPDGVELPALLEPSSDETARQALIDVPLPVNGTWREQLYETSARSIDAGALWDKSLVSAANQATGIAYLGRGTPTVVELVDRNATGKHLIFQTFGNSAGLEAVFSCAFRRGASPTTRRVGLAFTSATGYVSAVFDLVDGVVVVEGETSLPARIVDEGAGWFRCSIEGVPDDTPTAYIALLADSEADAASALSTGTTSWDYVGTAAKNVLIDRPRLFWGDLARGNYLLRSEDFTHAAWTAGSTVERKSGSTQTVPVLGSAVVARVGPEASAPTGHYLIQSLGRGFDSTVSVYVKAGTVSRVGLYVLASASFLSDKSAVFELSGTPRVIACSSGAAASVVDVGSSWRRLEFVVPNEVTSLSLYLLDSSISTPHTASIDWNVALTTSDYVDLAGFQVEGGLGLSSYKPTTSAPVFESVLHDGVYVPGAEEGDIVSLYRSRVSDDVFGSVEPSDDCYGVATRELTRDDLAEGRVRFVEKQSSDVLLTHPLYTNPTDGDVENAPNTKAPVGYDVCQWDARAWLGNVIPRPRLAVSILGTTGTGLVAGDAFVIARDDTLEEHVFTSVAPGTINPGAFVVHTAGSVSQNLELTARDLVRAINARDACSVKAYYIASDFTTAGQLILEQKDCGAVELAPGFSFDVRDSSGRRKIGPVTQPEPGSASQNEHAHNGALYSKQNEHEAWPILNEVRFGARQDFVRKLFGFRDRLYAFTRLGGIYVVVGPYPYRVLGPVSSAKLLGSRCVCEFADNVWALTDQGLGYITDSGFVVASRDVDRAWRDLLGPEGQAPGVAENAFIVADDATGLLYVWLPEVGDGSGDEASAVVAYVFNIRTKAWSTWTRDCDAVAKAPLSGELWAAVTSSLTGSERQLVTLRRTGTNEDSADLELEGVTLSHIGGYHYAPHALVRGSKLTGPLLAPDTFHFPLEETSGSVTSLVGGHVLTETNASTGDASGQVSRCRLFATTLVFPNQVGQMLSGAVVTGSYTLSSWTLGLWIKPTDVTFGGGGTQARVLAILNSGGNIYLDILSGGAVKLTSHSSSSFAAGLTANVWAHLVVKVVGTQVSLYKNGALVGTLTSGFSSQSMSGTTTLRIGNNDLGSGGSHPYQGRVDEVWWNKAASYDDERIADIYASQALGVQSPLLEYWLSQDAITNPLGYGTHYGPLVISRDGSEELPSSTLTNWALTLPVPAAIQWHPLDLGDFGVRKLFSQAQVAWSEETELTESIVTLAPDDGDFGDELVLPETTRRLQRIEPIPKAAADTNALKVRLRMVQAQKAWRLLGLRLEVAPGNAGKGSR